MKADYFLFFLFQETFTRGDTLGREICHAVLRQSKTRILKKMSECGPMRLVVLGGQRKYHPNVDRLVVGGR